MAHIPCTYIPIKGNNSKNVAYNPAPGGVSLSDDSRVSAENKCLMMHNFDVLTGRIAARNCQRTVAEDCNMSGEFHGMNRELFCGKTFIHAGTCLYSYEEDGKVTLLSSILPDKDSLFCEFMSKLYIYCDRHIFSVNNVFEFAEEEPFAPIMYENVTPSSSRPARLDVPYNMLSPRITVSYKSSDVSYFSLPLDADVSRGVRVYEDDEEIDSSIYTVEEGSVTINHKNYVGLRVVKISYYVKNENEMKFDGFVSGCRLVTSFGGDMNGGTRIFFTGNDGDKGKYYKSKLMDPLFVPSDEFEIIGNGSENITSLKKMYGDLVVFTVRSVYRMGYSLSQDGTFFSVKEISNGIGCDCPASVQLIDNRVVFLNSEKGVFIVDSTENTGEQNIKPIGKNILKGSGCGLLDNPGQTLKDANSLDFDRKYMLFVGNRAYIWDYNASGFVDYGNYSVAQERLVWYMYDGISGDIFFETKDGLTSFTKKDAEFHVFDAKGEKTDVSCRYVSGVIEEMFPFVKKIVTGISMMIYTEKNSNYSISLFADGQKYYEAALTKYGKECKQKIKLKLPAKDLYGFSFEICGNGGIEIEQMLFDFIVIND